MTLVNASEVTLGTNKHHDDVARTHPRLVPYDELPESEKQFDRATANPGEDFFSPLTQASFRGRRLTREEMMGFRQHG